MKKKIKKKPTPKIHIKNIALENETQEHIKGYLTLWGSKLDFLQIQRYKTGKNKDRYYGLAKIRSKSVT